MPDVRCSKCQRVIHVVVTRVDKDACPTCGGVLRSARAEPAALVPETGAAPTRSGDGR